MLVVQAAIGERPAVAVSAAPGAYEIIGVPGHTLWPNRTALAALCLLRPLRWRCFSLSAAFLRHLNTPVPPGCFPNRAQVTALPLATKHALARSHPSVVALASQTLLGRCHLKHAVLNTHVFAKLSFPRGPSPQAAASKLSPEAYLAAPPLSNGLAR